VWCEQKEHCLYGQVEELFIGITGFGVKYLLYIVKSNGNSSSLISIV